MNPILPYSSREQQASPLTPPQLFFRTNSLKATVKNQNPKNCGPSHLQVMARFVAIWPETEQAVLRPGSPGAAGRGLPWLRWRRTQAPIHPSPRAGPIADHRSLSHCSGLQNSHWQLLSILKSPSPAQIVPSVGLPLSSLGTSQSPGWENRSLVWANHSLTCSAD